MEGKRAGEGEGEGRILLQKLISAALKGFFMWYQCVFLHCQVQLEHNFAFFIQVEEINGISPPGLHFKSFDRTSTLASSKMKACF